jgi:hypothetical protein
MGLYALPAAAIAHLLGARGSTIHFGIGPSLSIRWDSTNFLFGLLPIGAGFKFSAPTSIHGDGAEKVGAAGRIIVYLSGCLALLLLGYALLGGTAMMGGFYGIWKNLMATLTDSPPLISSKPVRKDPAILLGAIATLLGVLNLLPLPNSNGGHLLAEILRLVRARK